MLAAVFERKFPNLPKGTGFLFRNFKKKVLREPKVLSISFYNLSTRNLWNMNKVNYSIYKQNLTYLKVFRDSLNGETLVLKNLSPNSQYYFAI